MMKRLIFKPEFIPAVIQNVIDDVTSVLSLARTELWDSGQDWEIHSSVFLP